MKFSTVLLPICILTTAQAADDASVSPFTYQEILNEPPVTLEEQAALRAEFFNTYENFMVHLFKQVNEMYTAGENGTEYDSGETPAGEGWTALDANNVHKRIQRYCKPEFDDAQQIISVDCGVSYAPEFLYSHPDYDNIYVTLYSHSIVEGAAGGSHPIGNGIHIAQVNEPTSPEDKLMRIRPKSIFGKVLITLDPPDFYCEFDNSREPVAFGSSEQEKNCSTVLREGSALLQRLL